VTESVLHPAQRAYRPYGTVQASVELTLLLLLLLSKAAVLLDRPA